MKIEINQPMSRSDQQRLDEINHYLLTMERPRISDEDREWNEAHQTFKAINMFTFEFTEQFIKESYPGGVGEGPGGYKHYV